MRLDALLSDVMTAEWRATLAIVTASSTCPGGRQRGRRDRNRIYWLVCGHASDGRRPLHLGAQFFHPCLWSLHWPSGEQVVVHFGHVQRRECLWLGPPHPCYTAHLVCPCQCLPHPVASLRRTGEPAYIGGIGVKRDAGRCPRLLEQRPNRGVLRAAASRRAGPHPPQILTGRGDGFLFGGPGNSETWCGDGPGRGRFASENAAAHTAGWRALPPTVALRSATVRYLVELVS